ncbi:MAG: hypothetical protein QME47_00205 [Candidatus Thermoplasmatota archaeon]|nr:hypothetical protein [Candidatus Thermoplasmatota archaeon]
MSKRLVIIFATVGIALLALLAIASKPISVELNALRSYDGKEVIAQGVVTEKYATKSGNTVLRLQYDNTTVPVFVKGLLNVDAGDEIRVAGKVQSYNGEYEIVVFDSSKVDTINKWSDSSISVAQLKYEPEKYKGTNINVTGYAHSISSTSFTLVDNISTCRCFIKVIIRKTLALPTEKQLVYVKALLVYDENSFGYFLKLDSTAHGVGVID